VSIKRQAVDNGVVLIGLHKIQCNTEIRGLDSTEFLIGENLTVGRQLSEQSLGDIHAHFGQALAGIFR
jgi:hypothetical protein